MHLPESPVIFALQNLRFAMKTIQILAIAGICLALTANQQTTAQTAYSTRFKVPTQAPGIEEILNNNDVTVNDKAFNRFHQTYTNVTEEKWSSTPEGSRVRFVFNGIRMIESYDKQGDWTATMRYLPLNMIPADVTQNVMQTYAGYKIFFAKETKTSEGISHIIKIENASCWKMLKISNGRMEIKEDQPK